MFDVTKLLPTPFLDLFMREGRATPRAARPGPKPAPEPQHWQKASYQSAVESLVKSGNWELRAGFGVHPRQLRSERLIKRTVRGLSREALERAATLEQHA